MHQKRANGKEASVFVSRTGIVEDDLIVQHILHEFVGSILQKQVLERLQAAGIINKVAEELLKTMKGGVLKTTLH